MKKIYYLKILQKREKKVFERNKNNSISYFIYYISLIEFVKDSKELLYKSNITFNYYYYHHYLFLLTLFEGNYEYNFYYY